MSQIKFPGLYKPPSIVGMENRRLLTVERISDAGSDVWRIFLRKPLWRPLERRDVLMTA